MSARESSVLVAMQLALLGEISSRLRAVNVSFTETTLHFDCYYDGAVTDEDRDAMSCVETELMALFPAAHEITHRIHRADYPERVPTQKCVFFRKEPN